MGKTMIHRDLTVNLYTYQPVFSHTLTFIHLEPRLLTDGSVGFS